jgi:hypothetical protein
VPAVGYEFSKNSSRVGSVRGNGGRRSSSRAGWRARPLRIFVIKALPVAVIHRAVERYAAGIMWKSQWNAAGPQHAESGNTHDYGAEGDSSKHALQNAPEGRHVFTPHYTWIILPPLWLPNDESLGKNTENHLYAIPMSKIQMCKEGS